eukprot:TRINITY_DN6416_c0_g1_i3.p1 TRINITY_DN6416_c0_g1~~TRINITY_DN6416_c0_g1_i3.p1  ORF type:complete len:1027 (+),score=149.42 TRINITY_DN6416_c0_g1_i3:357-3083(+)
MAVGHLCSKHEAMLDSSGGALDKSPFVIDTPQECRRGFFSLDTSPATLDKHPFVSVSASPEATLHMPHAPSERTPFASSSPEFATSFSELLAGAAALHDKLRTDYQALTAEHQQLQSQLLAGSRQNHGRSADGCGGHHEYYEANHRPNHCNGGCMETLPSSGLTAPSVSSPRLFNFDSYEPTHEMEQEPLKQCLDAFVTRDDTCETAANKSDDEVCKTLVTEEDQRPLLVHDSCSVQDKDEVESNGFGCSQDDLAIRVRDNSTPPVSNQSLKAVKNPSGHIKASIRSQRTRQLDELLGESSMEARRSSVVSFAGNEQAEEVTLTAADRWEVIVKRVLTGTILGHFPVRETWVNVMKKSKTFGRFDENERASLVCDVRGRKLHGKDKSVTSRRSASAIFDFDGNHPAWYILHPQNPKRVVWSLLGVLLMGYDMLRMSLSIFEPGGAQVDAAVGYIALFYWTFDVCMSFITGIYIQGQLCMRPWRIAATYMKSWFLFDIMVVFCQWSVWIMDVVFQNTSNKGQVGFLRLARTLRFSRVVRMVKLFAMLPAILSAVTDPFYLLVFEIVQFLIGMVMWIHISACGFYALEKDSPEPNPAFLPEYSAGLRYVMAAHWAAAQLQGSTDVLPGKALQQRVFSVIIILFSVPFCALFVSRLTNILMEVHELTKRNAWQCRHVQDYMNRHTISLELAVRVKKYVKWRQSIEKSRPDKADEAVLNLLPRQLKGELLEETLAPTLIRHCVMATLQRKFQTFFACMCIEAINTLTVLPEELIFTYGMVGTHAYMVEAGETTFYHYSMVARMMLQSSANECTDGSASHVRDHFLQPINIIQGRCVAEMSLWTKSTHRGDFRSQTQATIHGIDCNKLEACAASFPNVQFKLACHAHRFADMLNSNEAVDPDLFTSFDLRNFD